MHDFSVLIVDDDEVDRYSLKRLLKSFDYDILIYESQDGEDAVNFFKEHEASNTKLGDLFPPIIVFLDINMPRMNGFEFLEEFQLLTQQKEDYNSVVFMMITSSDNLEDKKRADQFEAVKGYINKMPKTADELLAHIKEYLPAIKPDKV
jgi:CheY-like chemotaxis protein